ncbi:MAG: chorismate mutase, partial [Methanobrevibacter sp.]|nr:chorismate mutase [Methanobrevibacter sp.]
DFNKLYYYQFGDFLKSNNNEISFENEKEARILLEESRMRIDEIDNELCDLISERTSLAKGIVFSKQYLGMPIYDESREKVVHEKIEKLAKEKDLDVVIIDQIVNMLTILSKNEQKEILRRNVDGQY